MRGTALPALLAAARLATGCTNLMVSPGASADGSTLLSYSCDGLGGIGTLSHASAVNGSYNRIGLVNEHAVAIGETTFDGNSSLRGTGQLGYYTLMEMALEMSTTAREMITNLDALVRRHGYRDTGEGFTIGDPREVWHMELIGKGTWGTGWVWVARRVPDGYVGGHANQARITTFPFDDPENCMYSDDVVDFAVSIGLYPAGAPREEFSFADAYDPITFTGARRCDARVWSFFSQVADPGFEKRYESYVLGRNLTHRMPLFVKAEKKVNLTQFFHYMRNHFEGTALDSRGDVSAGGYHSTFRPPPNVWRSGGHSYINERHVGVPYAAFNYAAQLRGWLPKPIGALNWFAPDDSSFSVHAPFHGCTTRVPFALSGDALDKAGKSMTFDSTFWVNNLVANFAYYRYDHVAPLVVERVLEYERRFIAAVADEDARAAAAWDDNATAAAEQLTAAAEARANGLAKDWLTFFQTLFFDFMDGRTPAGVAQGYKQDWYDRVAAQTGDRYQQPDDAGCDLNERKMRLVDRL